MNDPNLVHEYLSRAAARHPEKTALVCGEERWSYQALDHASRRMTASIASLGTRRQDRVVIFLDNSPEAVISLYGALRAGAVFVILDGTTKAQKLGSILRDSGASVLVTSAGKAGVVRDALHERPHPCRMIWTGDPAGIPAEFAFRSLLWRDILDWPGNASEPACSDHDLAALTYASGAVGEPKGIMSSHRAMISAAKGVMRFQRNVPDDIILNVLPLSLDYGLFQVVMACMFCGTVVLERSFIYPLRIIERIRKERATGFPLVPTIATILTRLDDVLHRTTGSLRYITSAAAAPAAEHMHKLRSRFPGVRLSFLYWLPECKGVSFLPHEELDRRPYSVGRAIPGTEVSILDENRREVGPGGIGELVVRGQNVMCGYWNAPELTGGFLRPGATRGERLFYSGDLFSRDTEGYLFAVGRKDDMIATKGVRISPREVENVLRDMAGVEDAAVIGVPDTSLGQTLKALIVQAPGASVTENEVLHHCSTRLEAFKVPHSVVFVRHLTRMPNGRIDKRGLQRKHSNV